MPQETEQEEEMQDDEVWRRPNKLVPRKLENVAATVEGAATTGDDGRWIAILYLATRVSVLEYEDLNFKWFHQLTGVDLNAFSL